jgi:hypothetical protein
MLWTYHLDGRQTSYEVCQSDHGSGFELRWCHEDGREECETFASMDQLNGRILAIEKRLLGEGWCLAGAVRR